ncbi:MAG TPA: phosphate ABC transporter permease subunit PstC [Acidimicrobiales bacterium]
MATRSIDLRGRGGSADKGFRVVTLLAGLVVLAILGLIAYTMTRRAWPAFSDMGLDFFTERRWAPPQGIYGALGFIFGTAATALIAVTLSVPVSIGIALFITQVAPLWLRRPMVYVLDLLAVVPSVVFGLWGLLVLSRLLPGFYENLNNLVDFVPVLGWVFGGANQGRSFMTAGIILAIMVTPIVTSLSREVMETTPQGEKEAALALGATRWEMIRGAVLPHSKGGLVGAVMLGLGRAMGETIAVALVIGSAIGQIGWDMTASGNSMPAVIANEWGEADTGHKSALIGLAVTLFVITIVVNMSANAVVQRSLRRSQGNLS